MKMFLPLSGHKMAFCLFFPDVFRDKSKTLAKLSGTLMGILQDLICMTELYMSDKKMLETGK